jgi:hypothetical protein
LWQISIPLKELLFPACHINLQADVVPHVRKKQKYNGKHDNKQFNRNEIRQLETTSNASVPNIPSRIPKGSWIDDRDTTYNVSNYQHDKIMSNLDNLRSMYYL